MKRLLISATLAVAVLVLPGIGGNNVPRASAASFVVTNLNDSGVGSLREAIHLANASPGPDAITFSVSGVINLSSPLWFTDPGTTIDGGGHNVTVDGAGTLPAGGGLFNVSTSSAVFKNFAIQNTANSAVFVSGDGSGSVDGLIVSNMNISQGIGYNGILIPPGTVSQATNIRITGSTISANQTAVTISSNNNSKITIGSNPAITSQINRAITIGGAATNNSDISISGNGTIKSQFEHAIEFTAANNANISVKNNTAIEGKLHGLQIGGSIINGVAVEGNKSITSESSGVAIGDKTTQNKFISISRNGTIQGGATWYAVTIRATQNEEISINDNGSLIGDYNGVEVSMAADNDKISISGNREIVGKSGGGIMVQASHSNSDVTVAGNKSIFAGAIFPAVEVDAANNSRIRIHNNQSITGASEGVFVGRYRKIYAPAVNTDVLIARNSITSAMRGIRTRGAAPGTRNEISNNTIYQNRTGIELSDNNVTIAQNDIRDNIEAGVVITSGIGNLITRNSIYSNGGPGIDLGGDGVTPNDPGDADTGPNNLQNYPVLTAAFTQKNTTTLQGFLNSKAGTHFTLEFFSTLPSGNHPDKMFLGSTTVTTDSFGNASFDVTFHKSVPAGTLVVATATDPGNNTSEFSLPVAVAYGVP